MQTRGSGGRPAEAPPRPAGLSALSSWVEGETRTRSEDCMDLPAVGPKGMKYWQLPGPSLEKPTLFSGESPFDH